MGDWRVPAPNPRISPTPNSGHGASGGDGTLDKMSSTGGMNAEMIVVPNEGTEKAAPKNPAPDWSA